MPVHKKHFTNLDDAGRRDLATQGVIDRPLPCAAPGKVETSHPVNFDLLPNAHHRPTHGCLSGRIVEHTGCTHSHGCHGIQVRNQGHDKPISAKDVDRPGVDRVHFPPPFIRADELSLRLRRDNGVPWHVPPPGKRYHGRPSEATPAFAAGGIYLIAPRFWDRLLQPMSSTSGTPLLEARQIVKRYGSIQANDKVDFTLRSGEVHALLGENGAGKSTLSKILYGFTRADSGSILINGRPTELRSPRDARRLGIGMVFQNFMLIPALSVSENVALFLADLPAVVSRHAVARRIRPLAERFGLSVDPSALVRQLSVGDQQKVEILKLLLAEARVLILDEPTKVLAPHEVEALFRVFEALKAEGYAILFITHKLREVIACADRITVMRQGRVAGELTRGEADSGTLVALMFGAQTADSRSDTTALPRPERSGGQKLLELHGACTRASANRTGLSDIDLVIGEREIVGVAGVSGNGQKELGDLILGVLPLSIGRKLIFGVDASGWTIGRIRESGVAFVPEDPLVMAAVPGMSVRENLVLGTGRHYWKGAAVDWHRVEADMSGSFQKLDFPIPRLDPPIGALSGGNLQRVVIAREMAKEPRLIVALYPTRGLDVRSAASVRSLLRRARDTGGGVLLISEDLEELSEMSDRLLVMYDGAVVGEFARGAWQMAEVGHLMTGSREVHSAG